MKNLDKFTQELNTQFKDVRVEDSAYFFVISIPLDRFRRHDHGGGDDGEEWLEDYEIDKDFEKGQARYQDKLNQVLRLIVHHQVNLTAKFSLGEKGHFSIEIFKR